jgi:shikimate kinase
MGQPPIILTGFMCSGKTTVAAALGSALRRSVVDLDSRITEVMGRTPKEIIAHDGEESFRDLEFKVLEEVLLEEVAYVIALGGGAWIQERNRDLIRRYGGISVWLDVPFEVCWARIVEAGDARPLATNEAAARTLYFQRHPAYSLADFRIEVGTDVPVEGIAKEIATLIRAA